MILESGFRLLTADLSKQSGDKSNMVVMLIDVCLGVLDSFISVLNFVQEVGFGRAGKSEYGGQGED